MTTTSCCPTCQRVPSFADTIGTPNQRFTCRGCQAVLRFTGARTHSVVFYVLWFGLLLTVLSLLIARGELLRYVWLLLLVFLADSIIATPFVWHLRKHHALEVVPPRR